MSRDSNSAEFFFYSNTSDPTAPPYFMVNRLKTIAKTKLIVKEVQSGI
jgi:hypothetical protein